MGGKVTIKTMPFEAARKAPNIGLFFEDNEIQIILF